MKAKTREEFVKAWESEFDVMAMLSESLPTKEHVALEYLSQLRRLRLQYIALAANETYGAQLCRYCEHMVEGRFSRGRGLKAVGFHCELNLVKPETGDLTAATCPKYGQVSPIDGEGTDPDEHAQLELERMKHDGRLHKAIQDRTQEDTCPKKSARDGQEDGPNISA